MKSISIQTFLLIFAMCLLICFGCSGLDERRIEGDDAKCILAIIEDIWKSKIAKDTRYIRLQVDNNSHFNYVNNNWPKNSVVLCLAEDTGRSNQVTHDDLLSKTVTVQIIKESEQLAKKHFRVGVYVTPTSGRGFDYTVSFSEGEWKAYPDDEEIVN